MSEIARDRDEALLFGMHHYYGTPCAKPGHGNVRRAANKHCRDCGVEYDARRRAGMNETQKEAERARKREAKRAGRWVSEDPEKKRERDRARKQRERESPEAVLRRQAAADKREADKEQHRLAKAAEKAAAAAQRRIERVARGLSSLSAKKALRRSREREAPGSHTNEEAAALLAAQGGGCAYCGTPDRLTRDHKLPLANGGTHDISNIQWLCKHHNSRKGAMGDSEYRTRAGIPPVTPWDGYAARALWYGLAAAA